MKLAFSVAAALSMAATPLLAQTAMSSGGAAPAASAAVKAPATATATSRLNLDTPIETIMADEKGKAVIVANMGDVSQHPMYDSFKSMSLNQVAPMSQGKITDEMLKKVGADLAAIK